jgi:hypothetical protein
MGSRWLERAPAHAAWTLITWYVLAGHEDTFVEAWRQLGLEMAALDHPPMWGVLLRNAHDPLAFSCFGPWSSFQAIELMRKNASVQEAFQKLVDCCHEAELGTFHLAGHIDAKNILGVTSPGCATG